MNKDTVCIVKKTLLVAYDRSPPCPLLTNVRVYYDELVMTSTLRMPLFRDGLVTMNTLLYLQYGRTKDLRCVIYEVGGVYTNPITTKR